jgi:hypothetical protein
MTEGELRDSLFQIVGNFTDLELKTGPPPMNQSRGIESGKLVENGGKGKGIEICIRERERLTYYLLGFCFVTFADKQTADNARKVLAKNLLKVF